ncbi:DNL zinc finger-domain-containing protein [Xylaria scruposa]|nr:DNL zinc finger-domain-containing protein [Xylaria scruposa]
MVSRIALSYLASISRAPKTISPPLLRPHCRLPRTLQPIGYRFAHAIPKPTRPGSSPDAAKSRKQLEPHYKLQFTCVPCGDRSSHTVSKQGYHHGSVLITCPSCRNRHIISDHLNIFGDRKITVEDLLREKGQLVKRGTLGEAGDIEFWEDTPVDSDTAASGEGAEDEARRLRETRDPSSQATDPTPSPSVLAGDAGTRPSVQGVSQQSPTPSTRRQYHTRSFRPPRHLVEESGATPVGQTEPPTLFKSGWLKRSSATPVGLLGSSSDSDPTKPWKPPRRFRRRGARRIGRVRSLSESEVRTLPSSNSKSDSGKYWEKNWEPPGYVWNSGVSPLGRPKSSSDTEIHGSPYSFSAEPFQLPVRLDGSSKSPIGRFESSSRPEERTLSSSTMDPSKTPHWLQESGTTPIGQTESPLPDFTKKFKPSRKLNYGATPLGLPRFPSDSDIYASPFSDLQDLGDPFNPAERTSSRNARASRLVVSRTDKKYVNSDVSSETEDFQNFSLASWLKTEIQKAKGERTRQHEYQRSHQSVFDYRRSKK